MEQGTWYQQGDVIIRPCSKIPEQAEKLEHLTLAEGEVTGHSHRIIAGKAMLYMLGIAMYLKVIEEAKLFHDEHNEFILPPGNYEIDKVREYDHFLEETRRVVD